MAQTTPKTPPTFAAWLRGALAEQEIPQTVLAKVTGIDASQINTYCTGKYTPRADNAWLIRKALDGSRASRQAIKRARSMHALPMIGPADGQGRLGAEALLCDDAHVEQGGQLWYGEREPETDTERAALERWRS